MNIQQEIDRFNGLGFQYDRGGSMEITTRIGCGVNCRYCPQGLLGIEYSKRKGIPLMKLEDFERWLVKIPGTVRIDFAGMCEPFLNPQCVDMILFAHEKGYRIVLYTTLTGLTLERLAMLRGVPFEIFNIHLADHYGNSHIRVDRPYIDRLIYALDNFKVQIGSHGRLALPVQDLLSRRGVQFYGNNISEVIHSRAGNVPYCSDGYKFGKIYCGSSGLQLDRNVLLPNGDVLLCCMDYGQGDILGNLNEVTYEKLHQSEIHQSIVTRMLDGGALLCRKCIVSKEFK
jgi:hypothetical protein